MNRRKPTPPPTAADRAAALDAPVCDRTPLPPPTYSPAEGRGRRVLLGVEGFARHTTNEGHQLQEGLRLAGFELWGPNFDNHEADVAEVLRQTEPQTVILQDKREWDARNVACLDRTAQFRNSESLAGDPHAFRLTICKDAHADPPYHRQASKEIGCHAWIVYYHPTIVCRLAPWIRPQHIVRTWHSVDVREFPAFKLASERKNTVISGACSDLYPFRLRLTKARKLLDLVSIPHPGYFSRGSHTSRYLAVLNDFKVSICTASIFGYSLRKIIESTAAGCRVITDLPPDDVLPEIDGNLIRIHPQAKLSEIRDVIRWAESTYDQEQQISWASRARAFYRYERRGSELAEAIEKMRGSYGQNQA